MLTDDQLAEMRAEVEGALPDEAIVLRATTENVGGEVKETWDDFATAPCRLDTVGGGEVQGTAGGRIVDESTHLITFPALQDLEEADLLVIADAVYEITLVRKRGAWELSRRCEAKEAV